MDVNTRYPKTSLLFRLVRPAIAVLLFVVPAHSYAVSPVLSEPVITNVTDRSFTLIWTSNQVGLPIVEVYSDAAGIVPVVSGISFIPYAVRSGNPALDESSRQSSIDSIVAAAKSNGVFEVTVVGLAPATQYYIKHGVQADSTLEITKCPDSGASFCPDANFALIDVTTENSVERISASENLFLNDVLLSLNVSAQQGQLVIVSTETANYPVSGYVGDGVTAPYVVLDLNNLYTTSTNTSLLLTGSSVKAFGDTGEALVVRQYKGVSGSETSIKAVNINQQRGVVMAPLDIKYGDCNNDGRINNYDHMLLTNAVAGILPETSYTSVAFHPVFCNLYKEDGLNSVATSVVLDSEDKMRLEALLVGKTNVTNFPEAP